MSESQQLDFLSNSTSSSKNRQICYICGDTSSSRHVINLNMITLQEICLISDIIPISNRSSFMKRIEQQSSPPSVCGMCSSSIKQVDKIKNEMTRLDQTLHQLMDIIQFKMSNSNLHNFGQNEQDDGDNFVIEGITYYTDNRSK